MPDLVCKKCGTEYNITEEYLASYGEEGKRCGCGEMMEIPKEECEDCLKFDDKTKVCFTHGKLEFNAIMGEAYKHEEELDEICNETGKGEEYWRSIYGKSKWPGYSK